MRSLRSGVWLVLLAVVASCSEKPPEPPRTFERTYSFRALGGVSMGAIGTAFLAGSENNFRRFDAIGGLGAPIDVTYLLDGIERIQMGGFCPLEVLEAQLATDPEALNDPAALDCGGPVEPRFPFEHRQHFNHWQFTDNGGSFDRGAYLDMFHDLSLALGNPLYHNPESPLYPAPGVENFDCGVAEPIEGIYNAEYNPEAKYPVIPFCDGDAPIYYCDDPDRTPYDHCSPMDRHSFCASLGAGVRTAGPGSSSNPELYYARRGRYEPCYRHRTPMIFGLAVDLNRNGKRDYHEPVFHNARERFRDVGVDGCSDEFEDGLGGCTAVGQTGDPNGDNFDPYTNPAGTERNGKWDEGEPFLDFGLDGVPGTGDVGEGNGVYDDSPGRERFFRHDFRTRYLGMTPEERLSLDVFIDGGIRDVFNLGLSGAHLFSGVQLMQPEDSRVYFDFLEVPRTEGRAWANGNFDPLDADYQAIGRNVFLRYGTETPTLSQLRAGDGDHVGTLQQVAMRFALFVKWLSARWEVALGEPEPVRGTGRRFNDQYYSEVLGAPRNFAIALPPGYDEHEERRYPVLMMLHGYGMEPGGLVDMNIVLDALMNAGDIHHMIIVYPSGRCCYNNPGTGERDCREVDDDGRRISGKPGFVSECVRGNFFVNAQGDGSFPSSPYGDSVLELLEYVEANYRTLGPTTVELPLEEVP